MCIIIYARYTFNLDDVWMWLDILHDKPIFNGYQPHAGRFFPLASIDLNLLMPLSHSPYAFFTLNALIVLSSGVLLWKILDCVFQTYCIPKRYQWFVLAIFVGLLLHPGFVTIMVGICYPERLKSLCLLAFVYMSLKFYLSPRVRYMALGIVSANLAIYLKAHEPNYDGVALEHSETSSLSIYSQSAPNTPSKGDFIIINSSSHHFIDSTYLKNMAQKYDLVYQSSAFTIPYITPKSLIKYAFSSASLIGQIKVGDENIFRLPQFDYIYQVR